MKYIFTIVMAALMLTSCEETTLIDIDQADSRIVIDALLTNQEGGQTVKVTRSLDFYANGFSPAIRGADVTITDDLGNVHDFTELEDQHGTYVPIVPFVGSIGRTYNLEVVADGITFTSSETMLPVTTIDSLVSRLDPEREDERNVLGRYYEVLMYTKEPQDQDNFYLFKFYRNGYLQNDNGEDITVTDDVGVDEDIEGIEAPIFYARNDTASVEINSLTRRGFIYWSDVANLVFSDGGVFSPLPANPRSNIHGGALGVFQVSAVSRETIVVD